MSGSGGTFRGAPGGRTLPALLAVTAAALALRLWDLGGRVFHWDEGRVAYWALRYAETGQFEYAPIIHGPFLRIVNATVFTVLPATDATARLVVALVGGLLPMAAWLFRNHLRETEVVALGLFLAFNPILVYYSRFMRNDVLVGAFAVVALGFAVRALDERDVRYCYPAAAFLALSATTKANTLLYALCFVGAAVLLLDHRLVRATRAGASVRGTVRDWGRRTRAEFDALSGDRSIPAWLLAHTAGTALTFVAIIVFFYAPRPELYEALASPSLLPGVISEATVGSARKLADLWIAGDMQDNPYLEFLRHELTTLAHGGAVLVACAIVGFVVDGYGRRPATGDSDARRRRSATGERAARGDGALPGPGSRPLVAFAFYWAVASLVGYPAATDINAPWSTTHVVLPLTIPAAVGFAYLAEAGWDAYDRSEPDLEAAALIGIVLLVASAGMVAPTATYWNSTSPHQTEMVQWAQPHNDARESIDDMEAVIAVHEGSPDVLFYGIEVSGRGSVFTMDDESAADRRPATDGWYDRLPLPWYYERAGAETASAPAGADPADAAEDAPPVVVAHGDAREELEPHLDGYVAREHYIRLWGFRVVFFVEEDALAADPDYAHLWGRRLRSSVSSSSSSFHFTSGKSGTVTPTTPTECHVYGRSLPFSPG